MFPGTSRSDRLGLILAGKQATLTVDKDVVRKAPLGMAGFLLSGESDS